MALPFGSGFLLQSFLQENGKKGFPLQSLTQIEDCFKTQGFSFRNF